MRYCTCLLLVLQYRSLWTVFVVGGCSEDLFHTCMADRSAGTAVSQSPAATPGICRTVRPRIAEVVQSRIRYKRRTPERTTQFVTGLRPELKRKPIGVAGSLEE